MLGLKLSQSENCTLCFQRSRNMLTNGPELCLFSHAVQIQTPATASSGFKDMTKLKNGERHPGH